MPNKRPKNVLYELIYCRELNLAEEVSIQQGNDPYRTTINALQLLDVDEVVSKGDKVVIKPNLCVNKHPSTGVTTHVEVVEAIINWIVEKVDKIYIVESDTPATKTTADQNFIECGYTKISNKKVRLVNLKRTRHRKITIKDGLTSSNYLISELLIKADTIINVPVLKTHNLTAITLGTKNLFGLLSKINRAYFHKDIWDVIDRATFQINRKIDNITLDLYSHFRNKNRLTIIDGIVGSEGYAGVVFSNPVHSHLICAGYDTLTVDYVGASLMGISPERVAYLNKAVEKGVGNFKRIKIIGEKNPKTKKFRLGFNEAFKIIETIFTSNNLYEVQRLDIKPQELNQILDFLHFFYYIVIKKKMIKPNCKLYMSYLLGRTSIV